MYKVYIQMYYRGSVLIVVSVIGIGTVSCTVFRPLCIYNSRSYSFICTYGRKVSFISVYMNFCLYMLYLLSPIINHV